MANASYPAFREGLMTGAINLSVGVIKAHLVRGYTYTSTHIYLSDVTGAGATINTTSNALTTKTFTGGVFDADDITLTTTASSIPHALILAQTSAVTGGADVPANARRLLFYMDSGTNLPIQPGAGTLTITWPNTADRIYRIGI